MYNLSIDPSSAIGGSMQGKLMAVGANDPLQTGDQVLFHQGNGQKFVFELPKEVKAVNPQDTVQAPAQVFTAGVQSTSFGHLAQEMVRDVNTYQQVAGEKVRDVLMGNGKSTVHEAMVAVQESSVAFSMLSQVRNKLLDSYQELNRMQI